MKLQITEQANGKYSIYTDSGEDVSMADETLVVHDLASYEVAERMIASGLQGPAKVVRENGVLTIKLS